MGSPGPQGEGTRFRCSASRTVCPGPAPHPLPAADLPHGLQTCSQGSGGHLLLKGAADGVCLMCSVHRDVSLLALYRLHFPALQGLTTMCQSAKPAPGIFNHLLSNYNTQCL